MNWDTLLTSKMVEDLGWMLAHSVWQIGVVAVVLFILLKIVNPSLSNLRYGFSVWALVVSLTFPVITFVELSGSMSSGRIFPEADLQTDNKREVSGREQNVDRTTLAAVSPTTKASKDSAVSEFFAVLRGFFGRNLTSIMPFAVGMWLLGVAFFSFRLCGGIWQLRRYKTQAVEPVDPDWKQVFGALCERLKVDRQIKLLRSTLVETPIAIGYFKPLIIIPASAFLQISPAELETIIAHELIHIRRYDPLVNVVQSVIEALLFYHPGVWWISSQIRREREFAADNAVMEIFGDSHVVYANALANLEEIRHLANKNAPRVATAANGGNLMQRIQRILKIKTEMTRANSAWTAGLAFVLISAVLTLVFSFNSSSFVNAQSKTKNRKVAVGFVSIPPTDRTENPPKDSDATARLLIAKLTQYKIPAIGFVNGSSISDGEKSYPVRANIVRLWRDAGFEVGIGGYRHLWFSHTGYDDYVANTEKNEHIVKPILAEKNLQLRYFSYPYLNTGKSNDEHQQFETWLNGHSLRSVKYTIDNNEWMYSYAYDMARNDNDVNTMKEIRAAFVDYMTQMFEHYEEYSKNMFSRDIAQTMVLTSSRLVTDSADDLFGMIQKRGYLFVSMDEAQSDEAYKTAENFAGDSGISWFERWTLAQGKPLLDEPKIEPGVQKIWDAKKIVQRTKKKVS